MKKSNKHLNLFKIILVALLVALNVILERIVPAYQVWNQNISFGFIAVLFAAVFLGAPYAVVTAGLGDFIGSLLFPFGSYFVGFTITNCIYGLILGFFLYKNTSPMRCILATLTNKVVCSLVLNTLWISLMYRGGIDAFFLVLPTRLIQTAISAALEITVLLIVFSNKSKIRITLNKSMQKIL